ncbi:MAG: hypothetical protein BWK73_06450 [Thiothrix lacustris]|uniref:Type II secretion system protein GspC N-terminal domain-containing protein n=1 Tax=Thiothrix lacustris TaxID=525917 RepID=A0A1Y1QWT0_9GAMM|nr:MAG: hypothetical protein BWK73_06450 [Thiothrix lacustris]
MKRLIKPPIQPLLWLSGALLLGATGWSLVNLKLLEAEQAQQASAVSVKIPDASALDAPDLNRYAQMVSAPLFWESRKRVEPEKVEAPVIVSTPVDTTLPEGRLIGIVDLGNSLFAIMENAAGGSVHLRIGDTWGAWTVKGIDPDRVFLAVGDQQQEIPLVADFSAPKENPQVAQARAVQQQVVAQQQAVAQPPAAVSMPATLPNANPATVAAGAGLPFPADAEKQPPALSVQEALDARQRLMASRWGGLTGENPASAPPTQ